MLRRLPKHLAGIFLDMVRYLTAHDLDTGGAAAPATDECDVTTVVPAAVAEVLDTAEAWLGWDGLPICADGNAWTPYKALRRVGDHLLDHLAEIECRLGGQPTLSDQWHGRMVTLDSNFARITEVDLDESTSRLTRLAACYQARLSSLGEELPDIRPAADIWTIREVGYHASHVTENADMAGRLSTSAHAGIREAAGSGRHTAHEQSAMPPPSAGQADHTRLAQSYRLAGSRPDRNVADCR